MLNVSALDKDSVLQTSTNGILPHPTSANVMRYRRCATPHREGLPTYKTSWWWLTVAPLHWRCCNKIGWKIQRWKRSRPINSGILVLWQKPKTWNMYITSISIGGQVLRSVCLSVCLSARICQKHMSKFHEILFDWLIDWLLPAAVARSSDGSEIRYVWINEFFASCTSPVPVHAFWSQYFRRSTANTVKPYPAKSNGSNNSGSSAA